MKIYQAGPLFSEADQDWHRKLKAKLQAAGHEVVWPFELIPQNELEGWGEEASRRIMEIDAQALVGCDAVVALLDGSQVDDGTAWEIGFAYAKGILVYGIRTDFRQAGETAHGLVNAMIDGSCVLIARTMEELICVLTEKDLHL